MTLIPACPYKKAGMIPDPKYGTDNILFKNLTFKRPVRGPFKFPLCIPCDPEVGPDKQSVPVGCFKKLIARCHTSTPYPDKINIGIPAQMHLIIIS